MAVIDCWGVERIGSLRALMTTQGGNVDKSDGCPWLFHAHINAMVGPRRRDRDATEGAEDVEGI